MGGVGGGESKMAPHLVPREQLAQGLDLPAAQTVTPLQSGPRRVPGSPMRREERETEGGEPEVEGASEGARALSR